MKLSYASFLAAGLAFLTDGATGELATKNLRLGSASSEAATDEQLGRALEEEAMSMPLEVVEEEAELVGEVPTSAAQCAYPPFSYSKWCQPQAYFQQFGSHGVSGSVVPVYDGLMVSANGDAGHYGSRDDIGLVTMDLLHPCTQALRGGTTDFDISATFRELHASHSGAFFGITMRSSPTDAAAYATLSITKGYGIQMYYRPWYGASAIKVTAVDYIGAPLIALGVAKISLRLTMVSGQTAAYYRFHDYESWKALPLTYPVNIGGFNHASVCGIVGSSEKANELATAKFNNVETNTLY